MCTIYIIYPTRAILLLFLLCCSRYSIASINHFPTSIHSKNYFESDHGKTRLEFRIAHGSFDHAVYP